MKPEEQRGVAFLEPLAAVKCPEAAKKLKFTATGDKERQQIPKRCDTVDVLHSMIYCFLPASVQRFHWLQVCLFKKCLTALASPNQHVRQL